MDTVKHLQDRLTHAARGARAVLSEMGTFPSAAQQLLFDSFLDEVERTEEELAVAGARAERSPLATWASDRIGLANYLRGKPAAAHVRNALSTSSGAAGGYTVGTLVAAELVSIIKGFGWMRQVATQFTTASGAAMNYPTSDGTSEVGERLGENTDATGQDMAFGARPMNTTKYSSKLVAVSIELVQDSGIDIVAAVAQRLSERLGRIQNRDYTVGSGAGQPTGLVTAAGLGKVGPTGQAVSVTFDDLADLQDSVDAGALGIPGQRGVTPAQRGVGWMLNQDTRKQVRRIKDTNGRPVWMPGLSGDLPQLLDYPVFINNDMPSPAANAKSIAFGNLGKYLIRDVAEVTIFRLEDSALLQKGQVGFVGFMRSGGNLADTTAVKVYQHSAT